MGGFLKIQGTWAWWVGYFMVIVLASFAEPPSMKACNGDAKKFCSDVQPGNGNVMRCLKSHETELSAECTAVWANVKQEVVAAIAACTPDAEKLCPGVKPGGGRVLRCLHQNESKLSPACLAEVSKMKNRSTSVKIGN
jgi:Cysteine rich repeat